MEKRIQMWTQNHLNISERILPRNHPRNLRRYMLSNNKNARLLPITFTQTNNPWRFKRWRFWNPSERGSTQRVLIKGSLLSTFQRFTKGGIRRVADRKRGRREKWGRLDQRSTWRSILFVRRIKRKFERAISIAL